MNCIFFCIFNSVEYVKMFYLTLESLYIYGNLTDDIEILIYTSSSFMKMIKESHLYSKYIKFAINDDFNTIEKACKARLDLFDLNIKMYKKILYLDTDILIKKDIHMIFDLITNDTLYTLKEGSIDSPTDYWGKSLFGDEIVKYSDKSAFTSGILLFNNCDKIKSLFSKINEDVNKRPFKFSCHDQPYIVYNAFSLNCYDNKVLVDYAVNNDFNIHSTKVIHHFPGGPGNYGHKIVKMTNFLVQLKDFTITENIRKAKVFIDNHLLPIIQTIGEKLEGNIFMLHHTTSYTDRYNLKAKNISNLVLNKNITDVMEIGFNSGFSALLMLISNENLKITCFDLGEHKYTLPCFNKLKEYFGDRINITIGDSTKTLPLIDKKFQMIHIDGGHSVDVATSDIQNSFRLSDSHTILIMDDYDFPKLKPLWNSYRELYKLRPLDINLYPSPHHDIRYVLH